MGSLKIAGNINGVSGAYALETIDTEEILYVGSAQEVNDAKDRHLHFLKNGKYKGKKQRLTDEYNKDNLQIRVIFTCYDDQELAVIEEQLIQSQFDYLCNIQKKVTRHSSNKNKSTTFKRRKSNLGQRNPNAKYDEKMIAEILWLKQSGYKAKQISEIYGIRVGYISSIGTTKWIHTEPVKPNFIKDAV